LPFFCEYFGPPTACAGSRQHMADHEPVKQHPQRREALFHRGLGKPLPLRFRKSEHFNIDGDVRRFHAGQVEQSPALAPVRKPAGGFVLRPPRVPVADVRGEEPEEPLRRLFVRRKHGGGLTARAARPRGIWRAMLVEVPSLIGDHTHRLQNEPQSQ
jgi:hypothetical protein